MFHFIAQFYLEIGLFTHPRIRWIDPLDQDVQHPLTVKLILVQQELDEYSQQAGLCDRAQDQIQVGHGGDLRLDISLQMTAIEYLQVTLCGLVTGWVLEAPPIF